MIARMEKLPLPFGKWLAQKPLMFSSFLTMTQTKMGASRFRGRLFKSAATSALALSAVAGGVILSGGEAKAVVLCEFSDGNAYLNGAVVPASNTCPGATATVGDKFIKGVAGPTAGTGDVEFLQVGNEYQVDVDFTPNFNNIGLAPGVNAPGKSVFEYVIKVTDPHYVFHIVGLSAAFGLGNNASVQKEIFTNNNHKPGTLKAFLACGPGIDISCPVQVDISDHLLTELYIRDTAHTGGQLIDNYQNIYIQSRVPAPLPILGAAAAFGSVRKARKFSAHLKSFSMG